MVHCEFGVNGELLTNIKRVLGNRVSRVKKKRSEEDACINNLRLGNHPKEHHQPRRTNNARSDRSTYARPPREKPRYQKQSLENISNTKIEVNQLEYPPSLRRCRSLALTKEDVFNSLEISKDGRPNRRAQLIPRVKLLDRSTREQRYPSQRASTEDLYTRPNRRKPNLDSTHGSSRSSRPSNVASLHPDVDRYVEENEYDSLEYHPAQYYTSKEPAGLKLPNYYPDSRYESDNTDNFNQIEDTPVGNKKYLSCDNLSIQNFQEEPESISYDENIVLSKNRPLYGSLQDTTTFEKPKTIRSPSSLRTEEYFSAPSCRSETSRDKNKTVSDRKIEVPDDNSDDYESLVDEKIELEKEDKNQEKIKIANIYASVEINPLYEESVSATEKHSAEIYTKSTDPITVSTKVEVDFNQNRICEEYKTVVKVDANSTASSTDDEIKETEQPVKEQKHSHKYLREFLESQKGSRKPLQNFLSRKFPNLSRRNSKESQTNLIDNNFYSLPDITACKNLKKCDKIDRKLRKCDKQTKSGESDNRFIVNIGKHFDITTNSNIPVDFELKIAKVPKKNRLCEEKPEAFLQAIQDLKKTLNDNQDTKPEIIAVQKKTNIELDNEEKTKMNNNQKGIEYKDKLDNMRNYWNKLVGNDVKKEEVESNLKVQEEIRVEEVKKHFEPTKTTEPINKVKKTKEIFENTNEKKVSKTPLFMKASRGVFENPSFEKDSPYESLNPNIVEIIENKSEERKNQDEEHNKVPEVNKSSTLDSKKNYKPVTKSLSITYPEFDHVRYRVVKSNLFQKKIFANCEKETQFDGLMQYLQDYSFQELLMDNNIVIIEPIRTTLIRENNNKYQSPSKNVTPLLHTKIDSNNEKNTLKKHFFFHPIRVNKEVKDDELPNPDTVKQVRRIFEKNEKRITDPLKKLAENNTKQSDPDKDHCSVSSLRSSNSEVCVDEQWDSFDDEACCEQQYITEDMMEKIRKYGTTITYYGGRIVRKQSSNDSLTNVIMEEIKENEIKDRSKCNNEGLKFKLVKSNSCSSRMELVGTKNLALSKQTYHKKHEAIMKQFGEKGENKKHQDKNNEKKSLNKNEINECIKKQSIRLDKENKDNKIYTKWGESKQEQTIYGIQFNDKLIDKRGMNDFHSNFEKIRNKSKVIDDMDFEPFEIA